MGRIFKQTYVDKTHEFFEQYGNRALILARFVPIVRTFVTLVAGVGQDGLPEVHHLHRIGGVLWACGVTVAGYYLGNVPFIQEQHRSRPHPDRLRLGDPDGLEYLLHRRRARRPRRAAARPVAAEPRPTASMRRRPLSVRHVTCKTSGSPSADRVRGGDASASPRSRVGTQSPAATFCRT